MTIAGQNFEIYQGDNKHVIITVRDDNGNVVDLTGYNAVWSMYNFSPYQVIMTKTTSLGEGITIPTPGNGQLIIELAQDDTADMTVKIYGHQCEVEDGLGNHATVTTGYMNVLKSLTHHSF